MIQRRKTLLFKEKVGKLKSNNSARNIQNKQLPALLTSFNEPREICVTLSKQNKKRGEKVLIVAKKREEKRGEN